MVKLAEKALSSMQMETCSRETSVVTKRTGTASIATRMVNDMKATGWTTCRKAMELKCWRTGPFTKVDLNAAKNTAKAHLNGLMALDIKANGQATILKALAFISGQMVADTKENGKEINCTAEEPIRGRTVDPIPASILTIRRRARAPMCGPTAKNTKATGLTESSTAKAYLPMQEAKAEKASGNRANA